MKYVNRDLLGLSAVHIVFNLTVGSTVTCCDNGSGEAKDFVLVAVVKVELAFDFHQIWPMEYGRIFCSAYFTGINIGKGIFSTTWLTIQFPF